MVDKMAWLFFIFCMAGSAYGGYKYGSGELEEARDKGKKAEASLEQMEENINNARKKIEEDYKNKIQIINDEHDRELATLRSSMKQYKDKAEAYEKQAASTLNELVKEKDKLKQASEVQKQAIEASHQDAQGQV